MLTLHVLTKSKLSLVSFLLIARFLNVKKLAILASWIADSGKQS